ncbi:MAG: hypothetical protein GY842_12040 [bacterium]|nr:hypothetical protein [bacterium]
MFRRGHDTAILGVVVLSLSLLVGCNSPGAGGTKPDDARVGDVVNIDDDDTPPSTDDATTSGIADEDENPDDEGNADTNGGSTEDTSPPTEDPPANTSGSDATTNGPEDPLHLDLSGSWMDGARAIEITQTGFEVEALYVTPYICVHDDGSGESSQTDLDFRGTLTDGELVGETSACRAGLGYGVEVGLTFTPIQLTVNEDLTELTGTWHNALLNEDLPVTIIRAAPQ